MNEQERELDLMVAELEQENRLLRARNERLESEALAKDVPETNFGNMAEQPAQRKPLTDGEIVAKAMHLSGLGTSPDVLLFARAIEAAHGIKGNA